MTVAAEPDVSVLIITYNHERFVGRALDSVLMQRGTRFELIVSEDGSSDATLDIVRAKLQHRGDARVLASKSNLACNDTVLRAIRAARGRYVSMLDGDDFWTVTDKLSRQVELLDADTSLAGCSHNALIIHGDAESPEERRWTPPYQPARVSLAELWQGNPFPTCATMLRRSTLGNLGEWYGELGRRPGTSMLTDWPLYLTSAEHGDFCFVDEPVGAYRLHGGGGFSSLASERKLDLTADAYRWMDAGLGYRHHHAAVSGAATYFTEWMIQHAAQGNRALARRAAWHALRSRGIGRAIGWRRWVRQAVGSLA